MIIDQRASVSNELWICIREIYMAMDV
jgi:hypothetical protein